MNDTNPRVGEKLSPFPDAVPLPTLKSLVWKVESDFPTGQQQYFMTEIDEQSGKTLAMLMITVEPERYIRIANIDTMVFRSEGFMRLIEHESKGFGFLTFSETREIFASYKKTDITTIVSSHDFALTDAGVVLDPPGAPKMEDAIEVLSQQEFKLTVVDVISVRTIQPVSTSELLESPELSDQDDSSSPIQIISYLTHAPVYSKTVVVRAKSGSATPMVFVKQTQAHFSKTEIDIASGHPNNFFHYTRFDKTVGYETVCHYWGETGGV